MSFFTTSDNKEIDTASGAFDGGGGSFEAIPEGTQVLALASEAAWFDAKDYKTQELEWVIKIKWEIVGDDYNGRVIFQNLRVEEKVDERRDKKQKDKDDKKRDKALRMLAAIDSNCGGGIAKLGAKPTAMDLANNLLNKPMLLKLGETPPESKTGKIFNWVMAVSKFTGKMPEQPVAKPRPTPPAVAGFDEDIPF